MINIECTAENQEQVLKAIEQALKGVDANITVMDEEITELDVMQFMSYNIKQTRVYTGRIEGRIRETRFELKEIKDKMEPIFEIAGMVLENMKREEAERRKEAKANEVQAIADTLSREDLSKLP